jgi:hypothetical protein
MVELILLLYFVSQKYINILNFLVQQISVCYVYAVKADDFIYTAFVSVN